MTQNRSEVHIHITKRLGKMFCEQKTPHFIPLELGRYNFRKWKWYFKPFFNENGHFQAVDRLDMWDVKFTFSFSIPRTNLRTFP